MEFTYIFDRAVQLLKAQSPMFVKLLGRVMEDKLEQFIKASLPIVAKFSESITDFKFEQFQKADS